MVWTVGWPTGGTVDGIGEASRRGGGGGGIDVGGAV